MFVILRNSPLNVSCFFCSLPLSVSLSYTHTAVIFWSSCLVKSCPYSQQSLLLSSQSLLPTTADWSPISAQLQAWSLLAEKHCNPSHTNSTECEPICSYIFHPEVVPLHQSTVTTQLAMYFNSMVKDSRVLLIMCKGMQSDHNLQWNIRWWTLP